MWLPPQLRSRWIDHNTVVLHITLSMITLKHQSVLSERHKLLDLCIACPPFFKKIFLRPPSHHCDDAANFAAEQE